MPRFLADVVQAWEAEWRPLPKGRPQLRVPVVRTASCSRATQASGFEFRFDAIDTALHNLRTTRQRCSCSSATRRTWGRSRRPSSACECSTCRPPKIGADTLIDYRLRLNGVPLGWRTRIEAWDELHRFVDVQVKGPYTLWEHAHDFIPLGHGTLMRDTVRYRLPAGWLGAAAGGWKVDRDVGRIFDDRSRTIDERFGA